MEEFDLTSASSPDAAWEERESVKGKGGRRKKEELGRKEEDGKKGEGKKGEHGREKAAGSD